MIINSVSSASINNRLSKNYNYNSKPQELNINMRYNKKQVSFCGLGSWLSKAVSKATSFFEKVKTTVKSVSKKVGEAIERKLENLGTKILNNLYSYEPETLSTETKTRRYSEAEKVVANLDDRLTEKIKKNPNSDPEKIIEIYTEKLKKVIIDPRGDGSEKGLNKVIGLAKLKTDLYNDLLMPLCDTMEGKPRHCFVPNGINFFGPKGTGKTYFAEQLGKHYVVKGGYYQKIKLSNDSAKDIETLDKIFEEAERRYNESGKTKYTLLLFDEMEKYFDKDITTQKPTVARLLELTNNCRDRGAIFMSTSNYLDKVEPALLRTGRTDLRIPVGHIAEYDLADIINYYLKTDNLPHTEGAINFQRIIDAVKTEKLQYKPKDVESRLVREADNVLDYGGELNTDSIKDALVLSKPEFDATENRQFTSDKTYAKQLGGIYEYDK